MPGKVAASDTSILVNRRSYRLPATTTVAAIAELAGVPHDNAVVERQTSAGLAELKIDDQLFLRRGDEFLVTRQFIMGGCDDTVGLVGSQK